MALIICPECKNQISDKAATCPHCGYPNPGEAPTNHPLDERPQKSPSSAGSQPSGNFSSPQSGEHRGTSRAVITTILVSLLIASLAGVAVWWIFFRTGNDTDERTMYDNIRRYEQQNSLDSLDAALCVYLDTYNPDARYYSEVKSLHDRFSAENADWTAAVRTLTIQSMNNFLDKHPDGYYREQANQTLDSLSFEEAKSIDTKEAYERYIDKFSDGKFVAEAEEKISELDHKELTPEEQDDVKEAIERHFDALASQNEEALKRTIAHSINSYIGKNNPTEEDIIAYMEKIHQGGRYLEFDVKDPQITKMASAGRVVYNIQFTLQESIYETNPAYLDDEEDEPNPLNTKRFNGTAVINEAMKITSLVLRQ